MEENLGELKIPGEDLMPLVFLIKTAGAKLKAFLCPNPSTRFVCGEFQRQVPPSLPKRRLMLRDFWGLCDRKAKRQKEMSTASAGQSGGLDRCCFFLDSPQEHKKACKNKGSNEARELS